MNSGRTENKHKGLRNKDNILRSKWLGGSRREYRECIRGCLRANVIVVALIVFADERLAMMVLLNLCFSHMRFCLKGISG